MDMLYSRYSCPMDLMGRYIKQGRFGKFVQSFVEMERERRAQEAEKEQDRLLWISYVQSSVHGFFNSAVSFEEYKQSVIKSASTSGTKRTKDMTEDDIKALYIKFFGTPQPQE